MFKSFFPKDIQLYPVPTEEPSHEKAIVSSEKKKLSGLELLSMDGHPVLYDYLSNAHTFWDSYADGRIEYDGDYQSGKTVLMIETYEMFELDLKEHMIRSFEIYPDEKLSLKDGLELTKTYLPLDVMKKWYALEDSECYCFKEDNEYWYCALYTPTKKGRKAINKSKLDYGRVFVLICIQKNIVDSIRIDSAYMLPNTGSNYKVKKWSYDFMK